MLLSSVILAYGIPSDLTESNKYGLGIPLSMDIAEFMYVAVLGIVYVAALLVYNKVAKTKAEE